MDVSSRRSLVLGSATNWLAFVAVIAVSFFLTPVYLRQLGPARYDVWCIVEAVLAYFTLLDLGVAACLVRSVARYRAIQDFALLNRLLSTSLALFLAAGCLIMLVGTPIFWLMSPRLLAKVDHDPEIMPFMMLMLGQLALSLPLSLYPNILDGLERFTSKSLLRIITLSIRTLFIIIALRAGHGLLAIACVMSVVSLLEAVVMAYLCHRYMPELRIRLSLVDRSSFDTIRGYSVDAFLAMLAGRITLQTGAIVIGMMMPTGHVTLFVVSLRLIEYAKTMLRTITSTLTPGVSAREAQGDWPGIRALFLSTSKWVLYLVFPIQWCLWFFGEAFLVRWLGEETGKNSYPILAILTGSLVIGVAQSVASRMLYGLGHLRYFARLTLTEAVLNAVFTIAVVATFGTHGVAWGLVIPNGLICLAIIMHTLETLSINGREYLLSSWIRPVLISSILPVIWLFLGPIEANWLSLITAACLGLLPYTLLVLAYEYAQFSAIRSGFKRSRHANWILRQLSRSQFRTAGQ